MLSFSFFRLLWVKKKEKVFILSLYVYKCIESRGEMKLSMNFSWKTKKEKFSSSRFSHFFVITGEWSYKKRDIIKQKKQQIMRLNLYFMGLLCVWYCSHSECYSLFIEQKRTREKLNICHVCTYADSTFRESSFFFFNVTQNSHHLHIFHKKEKHKFSFRKT